MEQSTLEAHRARAAGAAAVRYRWRSTERLGQTGVAQMLNAQADGGAGRSRTDLHGFAIRCITALLPRHMNDDLFIDKKGKRMLPFLWNLEREKSLELSTSTLARLRSTN